MAPTDIGTTSNTTVFTQVVIVSKSCSFLFFVDNSAILGYITDAIDAINIVISGLTTYS